MLTSLRQTNIVDYYKNLYEKSLYENHATTPSVCESYWLSVGVNFFICGLTVHSDLTNTDTAS